MELIPTLTDSICEEQRRCGRVVEKLRLIGIWYQPRKANQSPGSDGRTVAMIESKRR